jgi:hypothetical protein
MVMSKHIFLYLVAALCLLQACQEEKAASSSPFEATAVVKLYPLPLREGIDWNLEFATVDGEEVLGKAAAMAGTDQETLDQATRVEADLESRKIRITARHENEETAQKYAEALAGAFEEVRGLLEKKIEAEELARLKKDGEELSKHIEDASLTDLNANADFLNQDRMTYEKARKSLEENPVPDDGVLYRKEEEE